MLCDACTPAPMKNCTQRLHSYCCGQYSSGIVLRIDLCEECDRPICPTCGQYFSKDCQQN